VEVVGSAPPRLALHGRAAELAAETGVELVVSLTHSRELAAAVVQPRT
jgi:phosphopantetheinyl transferase (holo-ACP synthase)